MLVKEVMCPKPKFIPPDTSLQEAATMMRDNDYGFLPIGEDDRLIGTVTDRDLTVRATAEGKNPSSTHVREVMSQNVLYCWEDDSIEKAAKNMEKEQLHRLIVLNQDKRMTGVLSIGDIARKCHNDALCGEIIEGISEA